ncbi:MAG: Gfo/Idh/MocA family oxidoreductase [Gammaproteobacteria bacterium]|nr:Gfo/Idh/MocA family oxidoreductase [Gammaproteobacteria bacterium]NNL44532.1 Gfo/Idh/MocA family oxidoreductase [Woeseiaceae bacterium]
MIRFGILGAARIAPVAVIRPAALLPAVKVTAVAASSPGKARAFADQHDVPGIAENYSALIDSADVDAVYNALPPNLHEQWTVAALKSGKHVLCEKPFAMNAAQARRMVDTADASKRILVEAFHYRFHPYFQRVLELLADNVIGDIRYIKARFDVRIPYHSSEFRHDPMLGGGALMDLGCYPVHWVRTLMGSAPRVVQAECVRSEAGVDVATRASLSFPGGVTAEISTAMDETAAEKHHAHVVIEGDKGRLTLENPIAPHNGNKIIVESKGSSHSESISGESTYFYQLTHFVAIAEGSEAALTGGEDAVGNMQLIDNIYAAAGFARPEIV